MRIEFTFEIGNPFSGIKLSYKKWICKRKGHSWIKEKKTTDIVSLMTYRVFGLPELKKYCKRCGEVVFLKQKTKTTIKFRKYKSPSDLKKKIIN